MKTKTKKERQQLKNYWRTRAWWPAISQAKKDELLRRVDKNTDEEVKELVDLLIKNFGEGELDD
jgi:hypothetical protein